MLSKIAFQGELGAYSHQACRKARPDCAPLPCETFAEAAQAVRSGEADFAALPVENSIYGRVADIHKLLPESGLFIVDETLIRIQVNLLAPPGSRLSDIDSALSHTVLLGQCQEFLKKHNIRASTWADTAGAAKHVAELQDSRTAALASELAGEIYGLETLAEGVEDLKFSRTRFFVMTREIDSRRRATEDGMITAFMFQVRNLPAALFKALGGFATNHVNMIKLESYMLDGSFNATQFFAEVEGHPNDRPVELAMEELSFFTSEVRILGVYPAAPERQKDRVKLGLSHQAKGES